MINASSEVRCDESGKLWYREQYDEALVKKRIDTLIDTTLTDVLKVAKEQHLSPHEVAIARADMRLSGQRKERWIRAYEASRKK
jgi:glutamate dehydrogenase/leucine dehydrogenase